MEGKVEQRLSGRRRMDIAGFFIRCYGTILKAGGMIMFFCFAAAV